jgi:hypothetical protein
MGRFNVVSEFWWEIWTSLEQGLAEAMMEPTARAAKQQKHKTEAVRSFSMLCLGWDLFQ